MKFNAATVEGGFTIDLDKREDDRGFFARYFCEDEFAAAGLEARYVQINDSYNHKKGTLRGLHYQLPPSGEVKVVRCIRGALFDVMVDMRPKSPTFKQWFGAKLTAENRRMMYVPRGFAHGFITLEDDTEALYLASASYDPIAERGLRFNDPSIGIEWPVDPVEMSEKDLSWPDLDSEYHCLDLLNQYLK